MRGPALAMQRAGEGALRLLPGAVSVPPRNAWQGIELGTRGMKRSTDRILTTHVGSLIRPAPLQEFLRAKQASTSYDRAAYEACLRSSVAEVVRKQGKSESTSSATAS